MSGRLILSNRTRDLIYAGKNEKAFTEKKRKEKATVSTKSIPVTIS